MGLKFMARLFVKDSFIRSLFRSSADLTSLCVVKFDTRVVFPRTIGYSISGYGDIAVVKVVSSFRKAGLLNKLISLVPYTDWSKFSNCSFRVEIAFSV